MNPGIELQLDRPRRVKFTFSALNDLETRLGESVGEIFKDLAGLSFNKLVAVLHVGLRHEDRGLRQDRVVELIEAYFERGGDITDLYGVINDAVVASGLFGREAGDKEAAPSGSSRG